MATKLIMIILKIGYNDNDFFKKVTKPAIVRVCNSSQANRGIKGASHDPEGGADT